MARSQGCGYACLLWHPPTPVPNRHRVDACVRPDGIARLAMQITTLRLTLRTYF